MAAQSTKASENKAGTGAESDGKPPYPFRTAISLFLLAGNLLVAAIYFQVINP